MKKKLTAREALFIKHYVATKNASKSMRLSGYKKNRSNEAGYGMLTKPHIRHAIDKELAEQMKRAELTGDMIIAELRKHAFVKLKDAYDKNGKLLPLHKMPDDVQSALHSLETDELYAGPMKIGNRKKVKLTDKIKALEDLGRHFKLFTEMNETKVEVSGTLTIEEAKQAKKIFNDEC